ncbi:MAG TPA: asparagine synthase (glutamine-hydrolyzing) [Pyrinomonadaceae bacterium]|nr:asparagine synthase (glutamine-hydrolyzing) [Pyrinomonadaceae bacterium]
MCGIAAIIDALSSRSNESLLSLLDAMISVQRHRGPDAQGKYIAPFGSAALGHTRLSIIDLSKQGSQPMSDVSGRYWLVFNGEVYNYLELQQELRSCYSFRTRTDTEVVLASFIKWGPACLDKLIGMFAFIVWDEQTRELFAARDRFGVKPLYYHYKTGRELLLASEIKALHAAGVPASPDAISWATYLTHGACDHSDRSFWTGIHSLPPGHVLTWREGNLQIRRWYDLAERVGVDEDNRPIEKVEEEYSDLLVETVSLRFRSDVPVGINLSGGLDSSALLGLVQKIQGRESDVKAFTFVTGDVRYDELPWVRQMLARTRHPNIICTLRPQEVPAIAQSVQAHEDEPFGGLPTLAYARVFERARAEGVIVLLDGQGMDEQWAGYDYYQNRLRSREVGVVQGVRSRPVRPDCLTPEFRALAIPLTETALFEDELRNLQYRDIRFTKIPRALRFNDRISMRSSTELREPFLDHRLVELALRQPARRKIADGKSKWLLRRMVHKLMPRGVVEAPKRPLQTPQREWLQGPLRAWLWELTDEALNAYGGTWLNSSGVRTEREEYLKHTADNSFYLWQWISLGLMLRTKSLN